jgi:hypothetical protein
MHITPIFKINSYDLVKGVVSVTYTPEDASLELKVFHIPQLGINKEDVAAYVAKAITLDEIKARIRKQVSAASTLPIYHWNEVLAARQIEIPAELSDLLGVEWDGITEEEVTENTVEIL